MPRHNRPHRMSRLGAIFSAFPDPLMKVSTLGQRVMRSPESPLSQAERALVAAYVSRINGCAISFEMHVDDLREFDLAPSDLDSMVADPYSPHAPERLRPILALAKSLTEDPKTDTAVLADAIHQAGWDDRAVIFTVAVTGYLNMVNRLATGLDPIASAQGGLPLASRDLVHGA